MTRHTLETQSKHLISAIDLCLEKDLIAPGLILTYSTMDIMAWLDREETHPDVQRDDFIRWVQTYMLPDSELSCTATDLYAARCSLLHSCSTESRLSREGGASQIFYSYGEAGEQDLQALIDWEAGTDAKAVHVDRLVSALKTGIDRFLSAADRASAVRERAVKMLSHMPPFKLITE